MQKIFAIFDGSTDDQTEKFVSSVRRDTIGEGELDITSEEGKRKYKSYVNRLNGSENGRTLEDTVKADEATKFTTVAPSYSYNKAEEIIKISGYTSNENPIFTFMGQASAYQTTMKAATVAPPSQDTLTQMRADAAAIAPICRQNTPEAIAARSTWNTQYASAVPYKTSAGVPAPVTMPWSGLNEQGYFTDVNRPDSYEAASGANRAKSTYEKIVEKLAAQTQTIVATQAVSPSKVDNNIDSWQLFDPTPTMDANIVRIN